MSSSASAKGSASQGCQPQWSINVVWAISRVRDITPALVAILLVPIRRNGTETVAPCALRSADQSGGGNSPKVLRFSIDINSSVSGSLWARCLCMRIKSVGLILLLFVSGDRVVEECW